jgi:hypothetical protein
LLAAVRSPTLGTVRRDAIAVSATDRAPGRWPWTGLVLASLLGACSGTQVPMPEPVPSAPQAEPAPAPADSGAGQRMPRELEAKAIPYDEVLAVAGSTVLTESAFRERLALLIEEEQRKLEAKAPGAKVGPAEIDQMRALLRRTRVTQIAVADYIDTLGLDPDLVKNVVDRLVREQVEKSRQEAGSTTAFLQQLQARGINYRDFEEKTRTEIRHSLAMSEELRKLQHGSPLLATPIEMQDHYQKNRDRFVVQDEADVEALRFDAADSARAAATRLQKGEPAETVAKELGGSFSALSGITKATGHQAFVKDFALAADAKAGSVSAPIESDGLHWLLRVTRRVAGGVQPFESRDVQQRIRTELVEQRRDEMYRRLEERERARLEIWPPEPVSRDR